MTNQFDSFANLPTSLQQEAIREGEKLLDVQFAAATAADQRALTWVGFLIAAATGALGGGVALFNTSKPDPLIGYFSLVFAIALLRAAWLAVETVRPTTFAFAGNRPLHWLPEHWDSAGTEKRQEQAARTDQAKHLDKLICENRDSAELKAASMGQSFSWALWAVIVAGALLLLVVTIRTLPVDLRPKAAIQQNQRALH